MRIIGGDLKGRKIQAPKNLPVRPTTDQSKEALFNILMNHFDFDELRVLDLFSGTGNIALEFISRRVKEVITIDVNFKCIDFQKKTTKALNINNMFPFKNDVFRGIEKVKGKFDVIFADPPYQMANINQLPEAILKNEILNPNGWLIIEHGKTTKFSELIPFETRSYGSVHFSFFRKGDLL